MTERFVIIEKEYDGFLYKYIQDNLTDKLYRNTLKGNDEICDLLNSLNEENEQLRNLLDRIVSQIDEEYV